jgi:hypothetical protein
MLAMTGCADRTSSSQASASSPPAHGEQAALNPAQLKALYDTPHREDGVVLKGEHEGKHWIKWIGPDGTLRLSAAHGMYTDAGRVRVDGNQVCSTWDHIDKGRTACMRLTEVAPNTYVAVDHDGNQASQFNVTTPGAPPEPME